MAIITFNQLLTNANFNLAEVNLIRHRPQEKGLRGVFPWMASEKPELFDLYQSTQSPSREVSLLNRPFLASFIGLDDGKTVFIGLYERCSSRRMSKQEFQTDPRWQELKSLGCREFVEDSRLYFSLKVVEAFSKYRGRLLIDWGPGKRSLIKLAKNQEFEIEAIGEVNLLVDSVPKAEQVDVSWQQLHSLPISWQAAMSQWRGIYLIVDITDGRQYVGSAYGEDNILQRWLNYKNTEDGGNTGLAGIDPKRFRFSVLELTAPNESIDRVLKLENLWKQKLRSREFGLNRN